MFWKPHEKIILKEIYPKEGIKGSARYLSNRTLGGIRSQAQLMKLKAGWTDEEEEILKIYYPIEGAK